VIAPGVELALQLRLETPRLKATGYELLLFYPELGGHRVHRRATSGASFSIRAMPRRICSASASGEIDTAVAPVRGLVNR
jgi:hypothetical protein